MSYDAVNIEYAFADLIGNPIGARGTSHDADVFRAGDPKRLAKGLSDAVDALERKINALNFNPADSDAGGSKAKLNVAVNRLRDYSARMNNLTTSEPNDYHWEIIASLLTTISVLIDR